MVPRENKSIAMQFSVFFLCVGGGGGVGVGEVVWTNKEYYGSPERDLQVLILSLLLPPISLVII